MSLTTILSYILYILIPILTLYLGYLIITKAFNDMGFSSVEAIIIVFISFILGAGILDGYTGFSFANVHLFTYNNWLLGINTGGAIIPIVLSIYLYIKNKMQIKKALLGIMIVAVITYIVTYVDPDRGIVSRFPQLLIPAFAASLISIIFLWQDKRKAAPFAYICGTIGVLIGADVFHLYSLLSFELTSTRTAIIGGADIFDMIFITGILAVLVDGILIYHEKIEKRHE